MINLLINLLEFKLSYIYNLKNEAHATKQKTGKADK